MSRRVGSAVHVIADRLGASRGLAFAVLGLATSAGAIALLVGAFDVGQVARALARADAAVASLAVLTLGCSIAVRTARWRFLLVGMHTVPMSALARLVLIGYLGNSLAPLRFGDVLRVGLAARLFRLPTLEAAGSVIAERLIDTAALAVVIVIAVVSLQGPGWLVNTAGLIAIGCGAAILGAHLASPIAGRLSYRLRKQPGALATVRIHAGRLGRAVRATPSRSAAAGGLSILAWVIDGLTFWMCAQSLGLDVSWPVTTVVAGTAALGMAAPSGPAAIGTFELAGSAAGVALGMSGENALALVVFGHALTVVPLVFAGALSLASLQRGSSSATRDGRIHMVDGVDVRP